MDFLIDAIENAADDEEGEQLVDTFVPLILAFNQHFVGMNNVKFIIILTMFHVVIKWNNILAWPLMSVIFCDFGKLAFTLSKY